MGIKDLRNKLNEAISQNGINHSVTIKVSQELDQYIAAAQKQITAKKYLMVCGKNF